MSRLLFSITSAALFATTLACSGIFGTGVSTHTRNYADYTYEQYGAPYPEMTTLGKPVAFEQWTLVVDAVYSSPIDIHTVAKGWQNRYAGMDVLTVVYRVRNNTPMQATFDSPVGVVTGHGELLFADAYASRGMMKRLGGDFEDGWHPKPVAPGQWVRRLEAIPVKPGTYDTLSVYDHRFTDHYNPLTDTSWTEVHARILIDPGPAIHFPKTPLPQS